MWNRGWIGLVQFLGVASTVSVSLGSINLTQLLPDHKLNVIKYFMLLNNYWPKYRKRAFCLFFNCDILLISWIVWPSRRLGNIQRPYQWWKSLRRLAVYRAPICCGSTIVKQRWVWISPSESNQCYSWEYRSKLLFRKQVDQINNINILIDACRNIVVNENNLFLLLLFQMADPGRYLQCIRTLRDYAGKGCWEAQVCVRSSMLVYTRGVVHLIFRQNDRDIF